MKTKLKIISQAARIKSFIDLTITGMYYQLFVPKTKRIIEVRSDLKWQIQLVN